MILVMVLAPIGFALLACAWLLGLIMGQRRERAARRAAKNLPPEPPRIPIMAQLRAVEAPCSECGLAFRRHPAMAETRCASCVADAFSDAEKAEVEGLKAQGW